MVTAGQALSRGDRAAAATHLDAAVERYDAIGCVSDAVIAAALAGAPHDARVAAFAARNRAPALRVIRASLK
jgi:hypothetical protein